MRKYELHPVTGDYADLTEPELNALRASLNEVGLLVPIVLWKKQIVDGRHRAKLCDELGINPIYHDISWCPTEETMRLHVAALNEHRRSRTTPLTAEEKREKAATAIKADPARSDVAIHEELGDVSRQTVLRVRKELEETGVVPGQPPSDRKSRTGKVGEGARKNAAKVERDQAFDKEHAVVQAGNDPAPSAAWLAGSESDAPVEKPQTIGAVPLKVEYHDFVLKAPMYESDPRAEIEQLKARIAELEAASLCGLVWPSFLTDDIEHLASMVFKAAGTDRARDIATSILALIRAADRDANRMARAQARKVKATVNSDSGGDNASAAWKAATPKKTKAVAISSVKMVDGRLSLPATLTPKAKPPKAKAKFH